ncbi:MAG: HD domain-containing protein [Clostridia bacterium]|nr:HD domain-containing protein [Clostridia bacterium]NCC76596.1 HD domain-containing protein [Clostridia bacterium]
MNESNHRRDKILIVDSSPDAIRSLAGALPSRFTKLIATSGAKAFDLLAAAEDLPSLILLETLMPQMDGYEICSLLKADDRYREIPVIFISSKNEIREKIEGLQRGAVDFITKPFDPGEVMSRVDVHLKIFNLQQELTRRQHDLEDLVEAKAKEVTEMQLATIFALVRLTDRRDDKIGGHLERTQRICASLARKLSESPRFQNQIDEAFMDNLFKAAPLHDIGKVGIPDHIYLKPGRLTPEEFATMQQHTLVGAQTLAKVLEKFPDNQLIHTGVEIARYHHERWDGQGYPEGLAGEAIPLSARIMAVADVFDALRMLRPYKKPMPHKDSVVVIREGRGSHFDPDVVDAFLAVESDLEKLYPAAGWHA